MLLLKPPLFQLKKFAVLSFLSLGGDQMWPSGLYAKQILDRLQKNNSHIICRHLHYSDAGHGINIPNLPIPEPIYYHPVIKLWFSMGGTRATNTRASADSSGKDRCLLSRSSRMNQ